MFEILNQYKIDQLEKIAKRMKEISDNPEIIDESEEMGKNATVVFQMDTGLGVTAIDFYKQDPEGFARWIKLQRVIEDVTGEIVGLFEED